MLSFDPKNSAHIEHLALPNATTSMHVEDCKLNMPSDLLQSDHHKYCPGGLSDMEDHLRFAEACDTLENLCHHLQTHSFANHFKIANVTGQIQNTHTRETQHRIDDKVQAAELQYRCSQDVLMTLRGHGSWEEKLQVLEQSDVRALNERELTAQEIEDICRVWKQAGVVVEAHDLCAERVVTTVTSIGEGQQRPLWIWFTKGWNEGTDDLVT